MAGDTRPQGNAAVRPLSDTLDQPMERNMFRKLLLSICLALVVPVLAMAEASSDTGQKTFVEGEDYELISPAIRTRNPDKIEVVEFFWYGCSHCYDFEPLIQQWRKGVAEDVDFHGSPAVWNAPMELHAKAYYTAEVLGVLETMGPVLFKAMNVDRKRLQSEDEIRELFVANGVSAQDFDKAFESFGVDSMVRQAMARARAAKISGTPSMMVEGKYRVSARKAGGQAGMLEVVDFLVAKERQARGPAQ